MAAKAKVDWALIEPDWRAGVKSPQQIADEYKALTGVTISRPAIIKHFKALGIERNLEKRVKSKANAMVTAAMVTGKVTLEPATSIPEAEIVAKSALVVAQFRVAHRKGIQDLRELCEGMAAELKQVSSAEVIERLRGMLALGEDATDDDVLRQRMLNKLIDEFSSLPGRIAGLQRLTDSYAKLVAMERQAFSITEGEDSRDPSQMTDAQRKAALANLFREALAQSAMRRPALAE